MSAGRWILISTCAVIASCGGTPNKGANGTGGGGSPPVGTGGSGQGGLHDNGGGSGSSAGSGGSSRGGTLDAAADAAALDGARDATIRSDAKAAPAGMDAGPGDAGSGLTPQQIKDALAMPQQPFRFHHVHVNSVDPTGSVAFYKANFNATDLAFTSSSRAVRSADHWLVFDQVASPPPWELTSPIFHIGFGVSDVQKGYDSLIAAGVVSETAPFNSGDHLCNGSGTTPNAAFLYGPDREVFEINVASAPDLRHVHFLSDDPIAAGLFYVDHLGVSSSTPNPSTMVTLCKGVQVSPIYGGSLDGMTFYWYPVEFGRGYYPEAWAGKTAFDSPRGRALDHIAFSVQDLDRAVLRLRAEGVTLLQSPSTTLDGRLRSAFVLGPDGVELEIVEGHVGN